MMFAGWERVHDPQEKDKGKISRLEIVKKFKKFADVQSANPMGCPHSNTGVGGRSHGLVQGPALSNTQYVQYTSVLFIELCKYEYFEKCVEEEAQFCVNKKAISDTGLH